MTSVARRAFEIDSLKDRGYLWPDLDRANGATYPGIEREYAGHGTAHTVKPTVCPALAAAF